MSSTVDDHVREAEREWLDAWKTGPTRLRWSAVPPQVGDQSPKMELCSVDPERAAYESYGLLEGGPSQILFDAPEELLHRDLGAGMDLMEARREAGRPMVDSPWQLPWEFVIGPDGVIRLAYRYQYARTTPIHACTSPPSSRPEPTTGTRASDPTIGLPDFGRNGSSSPRI